MAYITQSVYFMMVVDTMYFFCQKYFVSFKFMKVVNYIISYIFVKLKNTVLCVLHMNSKFI